MSRFTKPWLLKPLADALEEAGIDFKESDEKSWVLFTEDFAYCIGSVDSENCLEIPYQFVTDFASIPKFLHPFISTYGAHAKPAMVHDFLTRNNLHDIWSRRDADRIFREAMTVCEVPWIRKWIIWLGVRVGGWQAWSRSRKDTPPLTLTEVIEERRNG